MPLILTAHNHATTLALLIKILILELKNGLRKIFTMNIHNDVSKINPCPNRDLCRCYIILYSHVKDSHGKCLI